MTEGGPGGLVRFTRIHFIARSGLQLMFHSLVTAVDLDSVLVAAGVQLAGCLWDRVTVSIRGMDGTAGVSAKPTSMYTTAVGSLRCTAARDSQM